ncbi:MAG: hypothetical protein ACLUFM_00135 [Lachnospiraceae bacterium]
MALVIDTSFRRESRIGIIDVLGGYPRAEGIEIANARSAHR